MHPGLVQRKSQPRQSSPQMRDREDVQLSRDVQSRGATYNLKTCVDTAPKPGETQLGSEKATKFKNEQGDVYIIYIYIAKPHPMERV